MSKEISNFEKSEDYVWINLMINIEKSIAENKFYLKEKNWLNDEIKKILNFGNHKYIRVIKNLLEKNPNLIDINIESFPITTGSFWYENFYKIIKNLLLNGVLFYPYETELFMIIKYSNIDLKTNSNYMKIENIKKTYLNFRGWYLNKYDRKFQKDKFYKWVENFVDARDEILFFNKTSFVKNKTIYRRILSWIDGNFHFYIKRENIFTNEKTRNKFFRLMVLENQILKEYLIHNKLYNKDIQNYLKFLILKDENNVSKNKDFQNFKVLYREMTGIMENNFIYNSFEDFLISTNLLDNLNVLIRNRFYWLRIYNGIVDFLKSNNGFLPNDNLTNNWLKFNNELYFKKLGIMECEKIYNLYKNLYYSENINCLEKRAQLFIEMDLNSELLKTIKNIPKFIYDMPHDNNVLKRKRKNKEGESIKKQIKIS